MNLDELDVGVYDTVTGRSTVGDQIRRHARNQPDHLALAYYTPDGVNAVRLTYAELDARVNRIAWSLRDRGVGRGDVVAVMSPNSADYVCLYLAAARLGAVTTGINYLFTESEITYQITHAEPVLLLADAGLVARIDAVRADVPSLRSFVVSGPAVDGWESFADFYASEVRSDEPVAEVQERDPLFMIYTSGTEAFPKAVLIPHRNYAIATAPAWGMGAQCDSDSLTGGIVRTHDRWLHLTPLHTIAGLGNLSIVLCIGASVILPGVVNAALAIDLIDRERCTAMVQTPTFFLAAVQHASFLGADLSSVQRLLTYGATMPRAMINGWNSKSPALMWATYWGQSELTQLGCTGWFRELEDIPGGDIAWIGKPVAALELILVDADGVEVAEGEVGEAWCRTPAVMLGYYKDPERTRETFEQGWLHTGDLMRRDADGNLFFADRRKDMIKSGGYNVSSQEVEKVIYAHPEVAQVAVVGLAHEYWSEAVTAFVVRKPGSVLTDRELTDFCKERAVNYKVPKAVLFLDSLPVDGQGKVLKRELRRLHKDHYSGELVS
ncbi:AMP-binding protein [Nakamurella sp. YIM 132087]|uniref:AMP-binding protein n=1 Tax=Nakamurella alba TaxID=2665158 RepID=A0A7K1FLU1_9ACTN|nr:class I adenylate-forming enzyme family protein [Nakamurella alba]MTD15125.1 AMP-binding protein [Nakamurella alba]